MSKILITLPSNRLKIGSLQVLADDGTVEFGPITALGKGDNAAALKAHNPSRDPTRPFGDTPLGDYAPAGFSPHDPPGDMGPQIIWLDGIAGDALIAKQNGRTGLAIHGGRGDTGGPYLGLFPTDGCLRIGDTARDALALFMDEEKLPISIVAAAPAP